MSDRGRPRHPDVLTPREWDVLSLVREGMTNPEIAERLGISRDAVKYHVSEILGKLELRSREEAAAWQPEPARRPGLLRPIWASAAGPIGSFLQHLPWVGRAALVGTAGAAVAGVVVLGVIIGVSELSGDDDEKDPQPSASVSGEPSPSITSDPDRTPFPSATFPGGALIPETRPLVLGEATSLPDGWSMVLETGCYGCDGPTTGLIRVWRDGAGVAHMDRLFGYTPELAEDAYPFENDYTPDGVTGTTQGISVGTSDDGSVIAVSYCPAGCGIGGMAAPQPDDLGIVYRSLDGGVTWEELARRTPAVLINLVLADGRVVVSNVPVGEDPDYNFEVLPDGEELTPPGSVDPATVVVELPDGGIGWAERSGTVRDAAGDVVYQIPQATGEQVLGSFIGVTGPEAAMIWYESNDGGGPRYLSVYDGTGPVAHYSMVGGGDGPYLLGAHVLESVIAGNAGVQDVAGIDAPLDVLPALIDVATGEVHPITDPFLTAGYPADRYHVHGVTTGSVARVTGTGSCLNVREEAGSAAPSLACVADGVLLRHAGEAANLETQGVWEKVTTPGGITGWVSADFLQD